ncbi:aliphatic sulfonate ABC transporter substrate-binding protein [Clostridium tyrobutyricum]|uniref:aliphatic sulfonate ABC transporter substrate-binding protein n=1 Tax=Clostridium tyrobutyricum TaxID=1519 RepID=UPI001C3845BA|nr:aliphatic sulfonate ABC transporter substrate-binding protein [Clostridium tyrobutyricum]MBV4419437.1 aliphatic sulfonate ABC transporter substrate-binding protein [Clostridium tyrobutyricum]
MKIKNITAGLLTVLILIVFSGCSNKKTDSQTVNIGFFPNITHSQALIGKQNKSFEKAFGKDIKVNWHQFNAGSSEIEAFLSGSIDIGYIGPSPAINGYTASSGDVQIISGAADAGSVLVSRKDVNIKSLKQLANKRIAVPEFGNTQDLSLRNILKKYGLKDKTKGGNVEIVQSDNSAIKSLMVTEQIDAALVPEPWGSILEKEVGAKVVLDYNEVWRQGNYPVTVVLVRKEFLEEHPELVEKFLKTHVQLTQYIQKNTADAEDLVNKQIYSLTQKSFPKSVMDSSFSRIRITNDPEKDIVNQMVDLSIYAGFLQKKPDTKNLVNLKPLNKVLKEEGLKQIE